MTPQATEVGEMLDRFEDRDWDEHTDYAYKTIEDFARAVVEEGTFTPNATVTAGLNLTLRERLTGYRKQDMTFMLIAGMMLGASLERDVPMDSKAEDRWRDGKYKLPK